MSSVDIEDILKKKERIVRYNFSGVYFLICRDKIVYIGKASYSIEDRLNMHRSRRRMMFDSIYVIKADSDEVDYLEKFYIDKFAPKYNFLDNPKAQNNDRYTCFSIVHNKYTSMDHLSKETGINSTTLRVVMDPTNNLNEYQLKVFEKVREFLFAKFKKYSKPKVK